MTLRCEGKDCSNAVPIAATGVFPRRVQARFCSRRCRDKPIRRRWYERNREANNAKSVAYLAANRDAVREQRRQHRLAHPEKQLGWNRTSTLRRYGLTAEQYDAMLRHQDGVCAICRKAETATTRGGRIAPLSIDHDHATGRVRALLCRNCNGGLGVVERKEWLAAALGYLAQHESRQEVA